MLLPLLNTKFQDQLTDLHLSKLIMTVLTFRDISKFSSVNTANDKLSSFQFQATLGSRVWVAVRPTEIDSTRLYKNGDVSVLLAVTSLNW